MQVVDDLLGKRTSGPVPINRDVGVGTAVIDGGQEQIVELDLAAGKHVLICVVADRAGGNPHFRRGMISEIVVE
jgi:hypothetical protein